MKKHQPEGCSAKQLACILQKCPGHKSENQTEAWFQTEWDESQV
jgi:hypothetical protein